MSRKVPFPVAAICLFITIAGAPFSGCQPDPPAYRLLIRTASPRQDTLVLRETHTGEVIAHVVLDDTLLEWRADLPTTTLLHAFVGRSNTYRTGRLIAGNGRTAEVVVGDQREVIPRQVRDSLLTAIAVSTQDFVLEHQQAMFTSLDPQEIARLWLEFGEKRQAEMIDPLRNRISAEEHLLLRLENQSRIHNFLFFMGRIPLNLPPRDPFFDFVEDIDPSAPFADLYPHRNLYHFEVEYFRNAGEGLSRKQNAIASLQSFATYIDERSPDPDRADFFKVIYLKELIEAPHYWEKHVQMFDAEALDKILAAESDNPYLPLLEETLAGYRRSMRGKPAYDFLGYQPEGDSLRLSDWSGKWVFLDVWATWCGPCVANRPKVEAMAEQFRGSEKIRFAFISTDEKRENWERFLNDRSPSEAATELWLDAKTRRAFKQAFHLTFIPRYILIDPEGKIHNAHLQEPDRKLAEQLKRLTAH